MRLTSRGMSPSRTIWIGRASTQRVLLPGTAPGVQEVAEPAGTSNGGLDVYRRLLQSLIDARIVVPPDGLLDGLLGVDR